MASPAGFVIRRDVKLLNYNFLHTSITILHDVQALGWSR